MNELRCDTVQDRIPDLVAGLLSKGESEKVRAHVRGCPECRETLAVVTLLREGRGVAPAGLADRIQGSVRSRRSTVTRPWWGVAAAAVAALALGIGVASDANRTVEVPAFVAEASGASPWLTDDGVIAGAPTLGDLTEEALLTLLDEMGAGPSGGAA